MNIVLKSAILSLGLFGITTAQAANAIVTTNLNLRTGPGTRYPTITGIPNRAGVDVRGCTRGYNWCQVAYRGVTGWASSRYLAMRTGTSGSSAGSNNFGSSAAAIGIPLIAGVLLGSALNNNSYDRYDQDRYYRDRYYRDRYYRDRYDRDRYNRWGDNNWGRRERPHYRPNPPQWNGGVPIGQGARPNRPQWNPGVPIGQGARPSQGNYYNPYNN